MEALHNPSPFWSLGKILFLPSSVYWDTNIFNHGPMQFQNHNPAADHLQWMVAFAFYIIAPFDGWGVMMTEIALGYISTFQAYTKAKLFLEEKFFVIIFTWVPKVQNGNGVLNQVVPCLDAWN